MTHITRFALRRSLFLVLLLLASGLRADEFPRELVNFEPYPGNPVFVAAGDGHWDVKIRERGWIVREGEQWKMWYTGYDGSATGLRQLGYATSLDGLKWTRASDKPLMHDVWVEDVQVLRNGDRYLMFAEGAGDRAQWLTSTDGLQWNREGTLDVRKVDGTPIAPGPFGTPAVWHEEGTWYLFYERGDLGVWLAKSRDLKTWTHVQDEPVLALGPAAYDKVMIALNQIVKHEGRYYAYYHGSGSPEKPRLWTTNVAVSTDLIHWKKYADNPLLPEKENKSSGFLVHDGQQYRLYTVHDKVDVHFPSTK